MITKCTWWAPCPPNGPAGSSGILGAHFDGFAQRGLDSTLSVAAKRRKNTGPGANFPRAYKRTQMCAVKNELLCLFVAKGWSRLRVAVVGHCLMSGAAWFARARP